jgi:hypothetical protein
MLTKAQIIKVVSHELRQAGYSIENQLARSGYRGDIIATKEHGPTVTRICIQAQGETRSIFGESVIEGKNTFSLARAFFKAAESLARGKGVGTRAAIALPKTIRFMKIVEQVRSSLKQASVAILWVGADSRVELESTWSL